MSFLQPGLLLALPMIALPVIIHLINRQRHRTVPWAAMMFLLDAKKMTRGMAKLRQWIILLMRMLAVAGLILALSRPLTGLWFGSVAGGATDTTIILLDRSASMEQQNLQTGLSKRATALNKLSEILEKTNSGTRVVLIESANLDPMELNLKDDLTSLPQTGPTSTSTDIPALLERGIEYIEANQSGRTDVWLCTDMRANDWDAVSGRWESVRSRASLLKGLRLFLLSYPDKADENLSVRLNRVRQDSSPTQAQLLIDATLHRESISMEPIEVPIGFIINGTRSTHTVMMEGSEFNLQGHAIPIDSKLEKGWGRIVLPSDSNPQDNAHHFVFANPSIQKTVIVSDDPSFAAPVSLVANAPMDRLLQYEVDRVPTADANRIDWESTAMLLWQGVIPKGVLAQQIVNLVNSGRSVIFFPPKSPSNNEIFGHGWDKWSKKTNNMEQPGTWRTDAGLFANTQDGKALPVGNLSIYRHCGIVGTGNILAHLESGKPLLTQAPTTRGGAWFCGTLPQATHSSLAREGVVLYVMLHRAIMNGSRALGMARQITTGKGALDSTTGWTPLGQEQDAIILNREFHAGAYRNTDSQQLVALNLPEGEETPGVVVEEQVEVLLDGIEYQRIDDQAGSLKSLASEIWRIFLLLTSLALVIEAILCLPEKKPTQQILKPS